MTLDKMLLLPVVLYALFIVFVGVRTARARVGAFVSGQVDRREAALDTRSYPQHVRKLSNNFDNQFQVPMLWMAGVAIIIAMQLADPVFIVLSWLVFALRVVHSFIHTGSNEMKTRFFSFIAGFACVAGLWLWLGLRLYVIG